MQPAFPGGAWPVKALPAGMRRQVSHRVSRSIDNGDRRVLENHQRDEVEGFLHRGEVFPLGNARFLKSEVGSRRIAVEHEAKGS